MTIRVLVVDDEPAVRATLGKSFAYQKDIEVVGEAEDGLQAVGLATSVVADVIIMDVRMPKMDGVAASKAIRKRGITTPIVFFTSEVAEGAGRLPRTRFVMKDRGAGRELLRAIREAAGAA